MIKLLIIFFAAVTIPLQAFAHTQLASSTPQDEATLTDAPKEIILNFNNDIRLTKVTLTRVGTKSTKLKLDKKGQFQTNYIFVLDDMSSGDYLIEWRGLGEDGHAMKGQFTFRVK